ncbi:hypothetical protein KAI12_04750 [Candidatus Bathyarchaeota archaeon]|nr:hypothetical protein [Candidatus Bathyarchaeota archaeon]
MLSEHKPLIYYARKKDTDEKDLKRLRFAKCNNCKRFTPFRLKHAKLNVIRCKGCGTLIYI